MNYMKDKTFLDTNIFVYAIDSSGREKAKSQKARKVINEYVANMNGVISTQVMQEFFVVATCKITKKLSVDQALEYMRCISVLEIVYPDENMVFAAARKVKKYQMSFWDAMIIQSAQVSGCYFLLSEDLQHGTEVSGVKIINPLA